MKRLLSNRGASTKLTYCFDKGFCFSAIYVRFSAICTFFAGIFLIAGCLSFSYGQIPAQTINGFSIRSLTVNDGLPQGWVSQLVQDKQGFIWIASNGLSRYDGHSFKTWQNIPGDTTTLASNGVAAINTDERSNLWLIYYNKNVDVMNTATGRIRHLSAEPAFKWITGIDNNSCFITQAGGLYFYGSVYHLGVFDPVSGAHTELKMPASEKFIAIGSDNKKQIWISTENAIYRFISNRLIKAVALPSFSKTAGPLWDVATNKSSIHDSHILADDKGNVIVPALGGMFIYNTATGYIKYIGDHNPDNIGRSFVRDADGNIYAIINSKLYLADKNLNLQILFNPTASLWLRLPLLADYSGNLWAATGNGTGLRILSRQNGNFRSYPYTNGFSHDVLVPWLKNPAKGFDFSSYVLRSAKDPDGNIWVTCAGLSSDTGKTKPIEQKIIKLKRTGYDAATFNGYAAAQLSFAASGQCWAIICQLNHKEKRLAKVDLKKNTLKIFADLPHSANYIYDVDQYLTAIGKKVCVLDKDELRLYDTLTKACTIYPDTLLGAKGSLLMAIVDPHNPGYLWIATKGSGIIKLDIKNGALKHYMQANGLPDDVVYFIAPDKHGYFWCSSNKGIFRFNPSDNSSILFTVKDGLQGDEFNRYHFLETPDGHFIFGGTDGYTIFHPDSVYIDNFQTPVVISDILVNNKPLYKSIADNNNVSALNGLRLNHDQNFLSLSFTGLEYNAPEKLHYRYKLDGIDTGWVTANSNNANYTFIPQGSYVFRVNATNTSGIWSNNVKVLNITILPPWWKTWWAYTLYLVTAGGIVWALYRNWLQRATARQQIILKEKEAEQLKAVDEMKGRFFSNITHEFRTPLSLILAPAGQMLNEEPSAGWKTQIGTIDRNARRMLQLINQLMDMARLEANSMKVSLSRGDINDFINDEFKAFKDAASAKRIAFNLTGQATHDDCLFDADKLHKIISNLLANAIKFTQQGGSVELSVEQLPEVNGLTGFSIAVNDNGPGISPEKLPFIFNRFYQADDDTTRNYEGTGIGLALANELACLMDGSLKVASEPGKGSTFTLLMPLKKASGEPVAAYQPELVNKLTPFSPGEPNISGSAASLILVVEDNDELREFIAQIFSSSYRVITAVNGAEGLKIANEELPDVIISDLMMPEMNGYDFCKAIKTNEATDHIAFLLLTAKTSKISLIEGLQSQADDYLTKPFMVNELYLRVSNLLNRQQQLQQHFRQKLVTPVQAGTDDGLAITVEVSPFLQKLYDKIDQHLDNPAFSVDQLAFEAAVSSRTLHRKLTNLLGLSAAELIKNYRLKRAAELLGSGLSVAETTYGIGYDSPAHFSTIFKSVYGVTPSEYSQDK